MMYLESIVINNYRPFRGENTFNFEDNINFNVISGKNGCGKSAVVNALYWCLYGVEISEGGNQPICNYDAIKEIDVDEEVHVFVTCRFIENNEIFVVHREAYFKKINEFNEIKSSINSDFSVNTINQETYVRNDNEIIFRYFPKHLFPFILFDSEYEWLSNDFSKSHLKKIFYKFSNIDILHNVDNHLNKLLNVYSKEIKEINNSYGGYNQILLRKKKIVKEINDIEIEIMNVHQEITALKQKCLMIEKELINYPNSDGKNIGNLYAKRNKLLHDKNILEENLIKDFNKKQEFIIKTLPILIGLSTINEKFNNEKLDEMLLKNTNFKNTRFYEGYFNIPNLFPIPDKDNLIHCLNRIEDILDEREAIHSKLLEIEEYISRIEDPVLKEANSRYKMHKKRIIKLNYNLESLKRQHEYLNKSLKDQDKELKRFKKNEDKLYSSNDKYQFCVNAYEFSNVVQEQFYSQMLIEFSDEINSLFIEKFKMDEKFDKIIIKDFNEIFLIKNTNQRISIEDLSTNERKVFNLSLIFTIHKCLELKYPIILMDPFVNLDAEKRDIIVSFILNNLENHQILLILNENQYDDSLKLKFIKNKVNELSLISVNGNVVGFNNG